MAIVHRGRLYFAGTPRELVTQYQRSTVEQAFLECIRTTPPLANNTPHE
jgi:hypothetical protein